MASDSLFGHKVNREEFLQQLESITPGLAAKDITDMQTTCFAFLDSRVYTFNDELTCQIPTNLSKKFSGAVKATALLDLLRKVPDDQLTLEVKNKELLVIGKDHRSGLRMESEILLPIDKLEVPKNWTDLPVDFTEAMNLTVQCADTDQSQPYALLHIHPKWVEACDRMQMARFKLKMDIKNSLLLRALSLKNVVSVDMTQYSETEKWMHFKNPTGLMISCRKFPGDYQRDLSPFFAEGKDGAKTALPPGLEDAIAVAEIFSKENTDANKIMVELGNPKFPGRMRLRGQGITGWHEKRPKVNYKGPQLAFLVTPKLLTEIVKKHNEVILTSDRLRVVGAKWVYLACLGRIQEEVMSERVVPNGNGTHKKKKSKKHNEEEE